MSEVLEIKMSQRSDGTDVASAVWNGTEYRSASRHGATMALARALCAAGRPESAWVAVDSGTGAKRLYGGSVALLAGLTVSEGQAKPKIVAWTPNPMAERAA